MFTVAWKQELRENVTQSRMCKCLLSDNICVFSYESTSRHTHNEWSAHKKSFVFSPSTHGECTKSVFQSSSKHSKFIYFYHAVFTAAPCTRVITIVGVCFVLGREAGRKNEFPSLSLSTEFIKSLRHGWGYECQLIMRIFSSESGAWAKEIDTV
jgi:hypothetical protein